MLYSAGNPLRVLVVDDEPGQVSLSAEMLRRNGHLVATAGNAAKALSMLDRIKVDVVLTDIQMPNGDGFHLLKQIKEKGDIPVIALPPTVCIPTGIIWSAVLRPICPSLL
jgi:CheY-like chemotaxis protein